MTVSIAGRSVSVAALLAGVGGLVAILSVLLPWATFEGDSINGLDKDLMGGKIVLIVGILIVAVVAAGILKIKIPQSALILAVLGVVVLALDAGASLGIGVMLEALAGIVAIVGGGWGAVQKAA
jgi:hypothetical protein